MLQQFNNKDKKVGNDLKETIKNGAKINIIASIFSIYGFDVLRKQLKSIQSMKFIFSNPTFIKESQNKKQKRMFEMRKSNIERAIGGSEFEINLKNELKGKAIAKECKKWIEEKVKFKSNKSNGSIQSQFTIENQKESYSYMSIDEFSSAGFGFENDDSIIRTIMKFDDYETTKGFINNFNNVWNDDSTLQEITDEVIEFVSNLYKENAPEFIYYMILYNIFNEFLEDISEDEIANEKTGFKDSIIRNKLYDFQKDSVLGIINKLEKFNGCILADSVGLGKTFSALGVIKYYQERNRSILVLCPKKLGDNWLTFKNNYEENPLLKDRFNYDVLHHTDLDRDRGESNSIDLSRINWGNYDLIVIDESHNFRNNNPRKDRQTRYQKLMENVIRKGVKTKVLMLSATPVNNRFNDLKNQLALAYEGKTHIADENMEVTKSINSILSNAQEIFNEWSNLDIENRTSQELLKRLSGHFDFFKLLDSITIARSRKHIEKYYDTSKIGNFPTRLKPESIDPEITDLEGFMSIKELYEKLSKLNMSVYNPFEYLLESKKDFYGDLYDTIVSDNTKLTQTTREKSIQKLMKIQFLKRLESSVYSFRITLNRYIQKIELLINNIDGFEKNGAQQQNEYQQIDFSDQDFEQEDWLDDEFSIGEKVKINLADMDTLGRKQDLEKDLSVAKEIFDEMDQITPEHDQKLSYLKIFIESKIKKPINDSNKKILIFTAYADTAQYLYNQLKDYNKLLGLNSAKICGGGDNECTLNINKDFNNLLINFSPISKSRPESKSNDPEIDILIATDCISEGQNLQDCDMLVNYDIHWNPVRIIQRFGRIDRIGSKNKYVKLVNFWPQMSLDEYIQLKNRVESRMTLVETTSDGENILTNKTSDLAFRKKQLEKLQNEVVDIEDMESGISIVDLGLNDFRMDLLNFMNSNKEYNLSKVPNGMHAVCAKKQHIGINEGVIFVLKNINCDINIQNINQLHPFYIVYISNDGQILSNHLNVKTTLDILKSISNGYNEPIKELCELFNDETNDGKNMEKYSELLNQAIESIINLKDEGDIDSLFSSGGTTALQNNVKGLNDFELICFVIIK